MRVDEILELIDETPSIEGVTLSGGEPFLQAAVLVQLASALRDRGLSRMAFTGYELCELTSPDQQALLNLLDIVVTGRFVAAKKRSDLLWRGSSNQEVHFLTDRYRQGEHDEAVAVEVSLDGRGGARVTGFPPQSLLVQLRTARPC
jgi:anaerobic ribonucleoside-triphosphate reductase activating protein